MRTPILVLCAVVTAATAASQARPVPARVDTEKKPWTHLNAKNDPYEFQFAVVTDRTGGHRDGVFEDGVKKLNLLQPEFVMSVGDLIEGYTEDQAVLDAQWEEFNSFVAQLEMPFFYVPGNHDISNVKMIDEWKKRFGRLYYHFVYKDVLFLCLDSEDPPSTQMSAEQIAYVKKTLADHKNVRWTLVFLHKPMWIYPQENGWAEVEAALAGRKHTVFAGHTHDYFKHVRNDSEYIVLATMGGGSDLRGPNFGEFDHFMWVTMTREGPRYANLMLDGIWDTNIMSEERLTLLRPVLSGAAVRAEAVIVDGDEFRAAATKLRLTNDGDIPMRASVSLLPNEAVSLSQTRIEKTVPPNSVELIDLEIAAKEPSAVDTLRPIYAHWTVQYDVEGHAQPVRARGTHRVLIDRRYKMARAPRAIKIDGVADEWLVANMVEPVEPGVVETTDDSWHGNADGSTRFAVAMDASNVYIAAFVQDDEIRVAARQNFRRQDSLEIWAAGAGDPVYIAAIAGQNPADAGERTGLPKPPEGVKLMSAPMPGGGGYIVEAAIPVALLGGEGAPDRVRVNLAQNDLDAGGAAKLWWQPDWRGPANHPELGVFLKR